MSFWKRFFGKKAREQFLEFNPMGSSWRVVSWNMDLKDAGVRQWKIEVQKPQSTVITYTRSSETEVAFFEDQKLTSRESSEELADLMNLAIHSTLKHSLEDNYSFMTEPVSGATTADFQTEGKALLWIQATFETLKRALKRVEDDSSLVLTGAIFSGTVPDTDQRVLRVLIFSLDIFLYMRPDQSLQVVIFDDKNLGHGNSKAPSFQQIIKVTKPQFYDEIVKLVHHLAMVGEIH
jgi:hypothetical protein